MQRKWKRRWQRLIKVIISPVTSGILLLGGCEAVYANPTGGVVTTGSAFITTQNSTMTIQQTTHKAIINWQKFDIAKDEKVQFIQPDVSSIALNRVLGSDASSIYGSLNANGRVFLINPNGILFFADAKVNIGGLVASALTMRDSDFIKDDYVLDQSSGAGSVVNQGCITAADHAVLIGPKVKNEGVIAAKVAGLVATNKVKLDFSGNKLLTVTVDTGASCGSVVNGEVAKNGGLVVMTTGTKDALLNTVVNNQGIIRAQSVRNVNGVIWLAGGTIINQGTLDASGKNPGQTGGTVKISGDHVTLAVNSAIDVAGDGGGGTALVDGSSVLVASGAVIDASAITCGNGGSIAILAKNQADFSGSLQAAGGSSSGNGGKVETSGRNKLLVSDSARVNTLAIHGKIGNWFLDPRDFTIAASGGDISGATLSHNLESSDMTIWSNNGSENGNKNGNGDIIVSDSISWDGDHQLQLKAEHNIAINNSITATTGDLLLNADGVITAPAAIYVGGCFNLASGTWSQIGANLPTFYAGDFRIDSDGTFIRSLGGSGSVAAPYLLSDIYGVQGIGSKGMLGKNYLLTNDIAASETKYWNLDNSTGVHTGFLPIGNNTAPFTGSFAGANYIIKDLAITRLATDFVGLFGCSQGTIKDVGLSNEVTSGNNEVGGLIGEISAGGSAINCYVTGSSVTGGTYVGGLTGYVRAGGEIRKNYTMDINEAGSNNVGTLAGENDGTITDSYASGTVTGDSYAERVGGLVGGNNGTITNCYALGGTSSYWDAGGLVGYNDVQGKIVDSYSTDSVNGTNGIGGLVGWNLGTITDSYASGSVQGAGSGYYVGGLIGYNSGVNQHCYWDTTASGWNIGVGSTKSSGVTGLTTNQMENPANFSDWNFTTVWGMISGASKPYLNHPGIESNEPPTDPVTPPAPVIPDPVTPPAPVIPDPVTPPAPVIPDPVTPPAPVIPDPVTPPAPVIPDPVTPPVPVKPSDPGTGGFTAGYYPNDRYFGAVYTARQGFLPVRQFDFSARLLTITPPGINTVGYVTLAGTPYYKQELSK